MFDSEGFVPFILSVLVMVGMICLTVCFIYEEQTDQLAISNGYTQVERVGSEGLRWDKVEAF